MVRERCIDCFSVVLGDGCSGTAMKSFGCVFIVQRPCLTDPSPLDPQKRKSTTPCYAKAWNDRNNLFIETDL
jgi:hypothetical protein